MSNLKRMAPLIVVACLLLVGCVFALLYNKKTAAETESFAFYHDMHLVNRKKKRLGREFESVEWLAPGAPLASMKKAVETGSMESQSVPPSLPTGASMPSAGATSTWTSGGENIYSLTEPLAYSSVGENFQQIRPSGSPDLSDNLLPGSDGLLDVVGVGAALQPYVTVSSGVSADLSGRPNDFPNTPSNSFWNGSSTSLTTKLSGPLSTAEAITVTAESLAPLPMNSVGGMSYATL